jgi:hypothetical protein
MTRAVLHVTRVRNKAWCGALSKCELDMLYQIQAQSAGTRAGPRVNVNFSLIPLSFICLCRRSLPYDPFVSVSFQGMTTMDYIEVELEHQLFRGYQIHREPEKTS